MHVGHRAEQNQIVGQMQAGCKLQRDARSVDAFVADLVHIVGPSPQSAEADPEVNRVASALRRRCVHDTILFGFSLRRGKAAVTCARFVAAAVQTGIALPKATGHQEHHEHSLTEHAKSPSIEAI